MDVPILVTGGTGTLGRMVVERLLDDGHAVRVLSRHLPEEPARAEYLVADLDSGEGVETAVAGVEVVVHCAGSQSGDEIKTRNLASAAKGAGVRHLVNISVVGADRVRVSSRVDRMMFGYFASKLAAELAVEESGVPWTTLRATQFHELMLMAVQAMSRMPIVPAPKGFRFQPVDVAAVAARLAELARGRPSGLVPDIAGPEVFGMDDLARSYLRSAGKRRPIVRVRMPGGAAQSMREGANLAPERAGGGRTWAEFLSDRTDAKSTT